jgi:hypothetical protein
MRQSRDVVQTDMAVEIEVPDYPHVVRLASTDQTAAQIVMAKCMDWCWEYDYKFLAFSDMNWFSSDPIGYSPVFCFKEAKDAMHFKLSWQ